MIRLLLLLTTSLAGLHSDVVIDLSRAKLDEDSGNYCVVQKVTSFLSALCWSIIGLIKREGFTYISIGINLD